MKGILFNLAAVALLVPALAHADSDRRAGEKVLRTAEEVARNLSSSTGSRSAESAGTFARFRINRIAGSPDKWTSSTRSRGRVDTVTITSPEASNMDAFDQIVARVERASGRVVELTFKEYKVRQRGTRARNSPGRRAARNKRSARLVASVDAKIDGSSIALRYKNLGIGAKTASGSLSLVKSGEVYTRAPGLGDRLRSSGPATMVKNRQQRRAARRRDQQPKQSRRPRLFRGRR